VCRWNLSYTCGLVSSWLKLSGPVIHMGGARSVQGGGIGWAGIFFPLLNALPQKGWPSWDFLSPLKKEGHCMPFHINFFLFMVNHGITNYSCPCVKSVIFSYTFFSTVRTKISHEKHGATADATGTPGRHGRRNRRACRRVLATPDGGPLQPPCHVHVHSPPTHESHSYKFNLSTCTVCVLQY
jgi:hypothetical protein